MNIYAPNVEGERSVFFKEMQHHGQSTDIIMGDFNVKLNALDSSVIGPLKTDTSRAILRDCMLKERWRDVWRQENPVMRTYSRVQQVEGKINRSRIDLCLVKEDQLVNMHSACYEINCISDHAFLTVTMGD